ncbi:MAG: winged helix-turn-helix domain-containing protein [Methanomassiliicoccales archaeon]|nr:winged helix-turn-helix domain-containing protein [Methanomassiliicoccales archaeon]
MRVRKSSLRYRSKGRIFSAILSAVKQEGNARPTPILYKANLSHDRLTKYLAMLKDSGLLHRTTEEDKAEYSITDKGEQFLIEFRRMEQFADAFGLDV